MCSVDRSTSRAPAALVWLTGALVAALAAPACTRPASDEEIASPEVPTITAETGTVERRDLVEALVVRGAITALPNQDVKLAAQVPGRVTAMPVAEGDAVRAGQVVAEIETLPLEDQQRQARAALSQAKAAVENARLNLARSERLLERGIAAGKEVEDARAQAATADAGLEEAQAALATADRQLARTHLTSPISGQVVRRFVGVGEQVDGTAAQPLLEVANVDQVEVAAHVGAEQLGRVRVGQPAAIVSDAWPDRTFEGTLVAIAPAIDPATNTALVRIRVKNPERLLKVGMFAQTRIGLQQKKGVLAVPPSAVSKGDAGAAVYVVAGDEATRTPVELGLETPEAVEIVSGVKQGQKVLTSGVHGLGERAKLGARP
jgi:RND family efflux transporter MFP subunit